MSGPRASPATHRSVVVAVPVRLDEDAELLKLRRALSSLVDQRASLAPEVGLTVVVVDDASPRNDLWAFLQRFAGSHRLEIHYVKRTKLRSEARGPSAAINTVVRYLFDVDDPSIDERRGSDRRIRDFSHFCYLHDDDVMPEKSIAARLAAFERPSRCGGVYGSVRVIKDGRLSKVRYRPFRNVTLQMLYFYLADYAPDHGMMWSRELLADLVDQRDREDHDGIWRRGDVFDPELAYMEDTDVSILTGRVASKKGWKLRVVPEVVYEYYDGFPGSISCGEDVPGHPSHKRRIAAQRLLPIRHFPKFPRLLRSLVTTIKVRDLKIERLQGLPLLRLIDLLLSVPTALASLGSRRVRAHG